MTLSRRARYTLGFLGSVSALPIAACTPNPPLDPGYVICDDTVQPNNCSNETAPVVVNNEG